MPNTNSISLNGEWQYITDPNESFTIDDFINGENKKIKFSTIQVPSNWHLQGLINYSGTIWYKKEFLFPDTKKSNDLVILNFKGVDYFTDVWMNWKYLGKHEGYFQPFWFDTSELIKKNDRNILIVKVSSPKEEAGKVWPNKKKLIKGIFNHHDCRPGGWSLERGQDGCTGGIWNDVILNYGYEIYIESIKITPSFNSEQKLGNIQCDIKYTSSLDFPITAEIEFSVQSPSGIKNISHKKNLEILPNKNETTFFLQIKEPLLWWSWDLGKQNLYTLIISSEIFDEQQINFGFREVRLNEKEEFFLNGKRLFLRGTNIIPEQYLSSLTNERITRFVKLIKEANINIVRVHAHINRQELYDELDRNGILVWQDFALQWTYENSPEFTANAIAQIKDMVRILFNHPSIVFWCCHNEPGEQINSLDHYLENTVLSEDSSRIVRTASNYEEHPYDGWYWGVKEHFAAAPMGPLVTEFGAQALPELQTLKKFIPEQKLFPPEKELWEYHNFQFDQTFNIAKVELGNDITSFIQNSQRYQADLLDTAVNFYRRKRFNGITGIFQFMFIDCWPSITWSIVDYYGIKKSGYEALKQVYQPLFISIFLRQNRYYPGKKFHMDIYIINDLHKVFKDARLKFSLDNDRLTVINNLNIDEDEIIKLNNEDLNIFIPQRLSPGIHTLKLTLCCGDNEDELSFNQFDFEIVNEF